MMYSAITVYGDSILKGVTLENGRYVVDRSGEETIAREYGLSIRNMCRFGSTIEKGLGLIQRDLAKNGAPKGYALLEYGGNDSDFIWPEVSEAPEAEHICHTPMDRFCRLYREAIHLLRQSGAVPLIATLPPIDSQRYLNWICRNGLDRDNILRWLGDIQLIYRWQERYSLAVRDIAAAEDVPLIDLRGAFLARRHMPELICGDGIHPSREGQKVILQAFRDIIDRETALISA